MDVGLLEGIKGVFLDGTPIEQVPKDKRMEKSIIDHLSLLFNERSIKPEAKEDDIPNCANPGYGLPDMSEIFIISKETQRSETLRLKLEEAVKKFEPRLTDVEVMGENLKISEHRLAFLLKGQMLADDEAVKFKTTFSLTEPAMVEPHKAKAST
jgi:type VI secretion system lysozyme-like protein